MLILGISGSPRKRSSSDILLDHLLVQSRKAGARTKKVRVSDLKIGPCSGCGGCHASARCVKRDDMASLCHLIESADGIIVSSPIYFGNVTAQLKCAIDRCYQIWVKKYILRHGALDPRKRFGIFLCTASLNRRDLFEGTLKTIDTFFLTNDIKRIKTLFVPGINISSDILMKKRALLKAGEFGRLIVERLKNG